MRIGNVEDMDKEKTEDADNLAKLIKSSPEENMTKAEKASNWWYYRKWYVIGGIVIVLLLFHLIGTLLGFWTTEPDLQIAYLGKYTLPDEVESALEREFATIAGDYNGDGEVVVQVNQYSMPGQAEENPALMYEYGNEVPLIGDIAACGSFLFLTDEPDGLQQWVHVLSDLNGNEPADDDYSIDDKVIAWADCPILANMELGEFDATYGYGDAIMMDSQEFLSEFYIGRRYYIESKIPDNYEKYCELWDTICNSR